LRRDQDALFRDKKKARNSNHKAGTKIPSFELKKARNSNHLSRDQDALFRDKKKARNSNHLRRDQDALFRVKKGKKFKSLEKGPRCPLSS
jgi:flagellar basal body rod protein FlgF